MRFKTVCAIVLLLSSIIGADVRSFAQTTNVRVAFNGFGGIAPIYLGQDVGIFKKQGLNLEMIFIPGGSLSLQALIGKSLEILMVETLGTAVGKNVNFPPERLVDYTLLREVQKELGVQ